MTDQTPVQAAAKALAYQVHMMSRPTPPTFLDEAYEAIDAATQDVEGLARVLLNEGAWCGLCDEPSWDCSECRPTVLGYAEAIRCHMLRAEHGSDR
jgi:hypothetical protein